MSKKTENLTPILDSLKDTKAGFKTPENYFGGIEEHFSTQIKLQGITKRHGFKVPLRYFETIESKIDSKISKKKNSPIFTLERFWIPSAIAAMLVLTFSISNYQHVSPTVEMADMEKWIENGSLNLNSYELAAVYENELDQINTSYFLDDQNIKDYLQDDIDELIYLETP